jgi:hypothetical protein
MSDENPLLKFLKEKRVCTFGSWGRVITEPIKTDHIVDANKKVETPEDQAIKNQPAVDLLTEWVQRPATGEEREAWAAVEKLVEESEPVETPEEAAERWLEDWLVRDLEESTPSSQMEDAFLAGVKWAEERSKK